ncbi:chromate transporter [Thermosipho ferrireducens]|uniref:Chromate transporter n=1 Tax=Thermosipho ferrireducens TaxID=2571116 RepID=A0ABX7S9S8_9BACT|nr:chromate transporter [Thermosipho ferrireducens]QTA38723.1 chromate transporter [Thermosipho ferrireducens]
MLELFLTFAGIGFLAFGGGWSVLGIIQDTVIQKGWLTRVEFKEIISVAQMTPGPVLLNTATYVGLKIHGIVGALLTTSAVLISPIIFTSLLFVFRNQIIKNKRLISALKYGVTFLIMVTLQSLLLKIDSTISLVIAFISFMFFIKTKMDPIYIILLSGIVGIIALQ